MALGNTEIDETYAILESVDGYLVSLEDCWNTFQYVAKNLGEWADDTVIGQESKKELESLAEALKGTIDTLEKTSFSVKGLLRHQRTINNGSSLNN